MTRSSSNTEYRRPVLWLETLNPDAETIPPHWWRKVKGPGIGSPGIWTVDIRDTGLRLKHGDACETAPARAPQPQRSEGTKAREADQQRLTGVSFCGLGNRPHSFTSTSFSQKYHEPLGQQLLVYLATLENTVAVMIVHGN